ncbi:hypothetical protein [Fundidesulfovibrio soli]|uniref:hypothetical protein n=1 Tax=Fundidesulfovibrio soli TaxID=2922716 RepID=UPI001FAF6153|nr:hypothetical protein [Fundidesulfovibrio soli]
MNLKHTLTALLATALLTIVGCGPTRDYTKLDPRCKEWVDASDSKSSNLKFDSDKASLEDNYEHYICIMIPYQHAIGGEKYFMEHWNEFLAFIPKKLMAPRADNETLYISILIYDIANYHRDEIRKDTFLLKSWKTAIDNMKHKNSFAYAVSN